MIAITILMGEEHPAEHHLVRLSQIVLRLENGVYRLVKDSHGATHGREIVSLEQLLTAVEDFTG